MSYKRPLQLRVGQVDVWLTSLLDVSGSVATAFLQLLNEAEQTRLNSFAVKDAALQYLVTRALVRTTLSRYAEVPAQTWEFGTNDYGRPHISHPLELRDLRFSLSNTTGLVACAVSMDCEIGVDVENVVRPVDAEEVAPSVFAAPELADFFGTKSEDRRDRFFSYWTLKEAYIKARGMGLSLPLDAFWFELGDRPPLLYTTDRCPDVPERWRFYQYVPTDEHMMAVAVAAPPSAEPSIHLRWVTPMSIAEELGVTSGISK